ncbi:hypothetical protein [Mycolicibacterium sediminis]|uniref:hypothetical protein n=1 Tax=Mycolicibacterium sediminis TaxID=1286180 RepID=UPI0013D53962|nr:hypothetical protein [Mycolicibacterium sediminis]
MTSPERSDDPVVRRAARELHRRPVDPTWIDISSAIVSRISRAARRTWPIDAVFPADARSRPGDRLRISDRVVRTAVRRAVNRSGEVVLLHVEIVVDGHRCIGARLTVAARHGAATGAVSDRITLVAADTMSDLLGHPVSTAQVTVHVDVA